MLYRQFTLSKTVENFQLTIVEGDRFQPEISPVNLTALLKETGFSGLDGEKWLMQAILDPPSLF